MPREPHVNGILGWEKNVSGPRSPSGRAFPEDSQSSRLPLDGALKSLIPSSYNEYLRAPDCQELGQGSSLLAETQP